MSTMNDTPPKLGYHTGVGLTLLTINAGMALSMYMGWPAEFGVIVTSIAIVFTAAHAASESDYQL